MATAWSPRSAASSPSAQKASRLPAFVELPVRIVAWGNIVRKVEAIELVENMSRLPVSLPSNLVEVIPASRKLSVILIAAQPPADLVSCCSDPSRNKWSNCRIFEPRPPATGKEPHPLPPLQEFGSSCPVHQSGPGCSGRAPKDKCSRSAASLQSTTCCIPSKGAMKSPCMPSATLTPWFPWKLLLPVHCKGADGEKSGR
mmetsp:Transcript_115890/g.231038  ORF Transcript_115890/g.231038 Transcript_115890/m.231038 type:complete len:200 (-) Transcript_115890:515-1114(-)